VAAAPSATATITYSDIFGNTVSDLDPPFAPAIGTANQDPMFVSAASHDYHLQAGSVCIDNGTATNALNDDFDGVTRPQGLGYDMGAFEFAPATGSSSSSSGGSSSNSTSGASSSGIGGGSPGSGGASGSASNASSSQVAGGSGGSGGSSDAMTSAS